MPRKKPKPNSFQDWAENQALVERVIDLKKLWAKEEDKELDPAKVATLLRK